MILISDINLMLILILISDINFYWYKSLLFWKPFYSIKQTDKFCDKLVSTLRQNVYIWSKQYIH